MSGLSCLTFCWFLHSLTFDKRFEDDCVQLGRLLFRVMDREQVPMIEDLLDLIVRRRVYYY